MSDLQTPKSLKQALTWLAQDPTLVPIAGCTDVFVELHFGLREKNEHRFLNLWGLDKLRQIEVTAKSIKLGALVTYTDIIRSKALNKKLPSLVEASRLVGGVQIQNRGTLGGNIANGSPAGDSLPVLLATDAVLTLQSASGKRRIPLTEFYTGYRQSVLQPGELITQITVPLPTGEQWFRKVGTRAAQAISKIVFAGVRSTQPTIAIGSVGPTVMRLPKTEAALAEGGLDAGIVALKSEITPIDDIRSSAKYRMQVAQNLLEQFWNETSP